MLTFRLDPEKSTDFCPELFNPRRQFNRKLKTARVVVFIQLIAVYPHNCRLLLSTKVNFIEIFYNIETQLTHKETNMAIDWMLVKDFGGREMGAVGFIGNKASIVTSFFDDADGNMDGKVSTGEWVASKLSPISLDNRAVTNVAMEARYNMDIMLRDASFREMSANMYMNFARGLVAGGIYAVYFTQGVGAIAKPIAGRLASGMVIPFVIKKGMEAAVKKLCKETMN